MATMRRRLLAVLPLSRAVPEPRPHCRFLHSPSLLDAIAASASPSPNLLSRISGSLPTTSAGAVVADAPTGSPRDAWSLDLLYRKLGDCLPSSWTLLRGVAALRSICLHWRSSPDGPDVMVLMLIGANVAAYALYRLAGPRFKMNHFTTSLENFNSGRLHTFLTSAFSHSNANHLVKNMTSLYFFGSNISGMFGPSFLLKLYLAGALTGSAVFLADMAFLAPRREGFGGWRTRMVGAGGAVNAILLLHIFLYPRQLLNLHYVIPIPAAFVGARLIGADLWRTMKGQSRASVTTYVFVAAVVWAKLKSRI